MPVVVFLGLTGGIAVLATTIAAGLTIYGVLNGLDSLEKVFAWAKDFAVSIPEQGFVIGTIVIAWAVISIPGFLLMANSLNTENQMMQLEEGKKSKKELAEISKALVELQRINSITNSYLEKMSR